MKITKINILSALDAVKSVANKRTSYPVVNCVRLSSEGQTLSVRATDLEQDETRQCPCEGRLAPTLVSAAKFSDLLQFARDEIELEIDKNHLVVTSNGVTKLSIQDVTQFPSVPDDKFAAIGISTSDLADGINAVAWARRMENDTNLAFQSVHVRTGAASVICEATNRNTVAQFIRASVAADSDFMIPSAYIERFKGLLTMPGATVHLGDRYLRIQHETGEYFCRRVEGMFPGVEKLFGAKPTTIGRLEIDPVFEAARTCMLLSADEWSHGQMNFGKEGITIKFESPYDSHVVNIPGKFKALDANVNFATFADCLKAFPDEVIDFVTLDDGQPKPILMMKNNELKVITTQLDKPGTVRKEPKAEAVPA